MERDVFHNFNKKFYLFIVIFFAFFTDLLLAETLTIRLGYSDAEAFPYQIAHDTQPPGIAFDIINRTAEQLKLKIVYVQLPNKRVLHSLQQGEVDGAFMYSYNSEREQFGVYPMKSGKPDEKRRIATLNYFMYTLKNSPLRWDGEKLSGVDFSAMNNKIGANTGYSIVNDLRKIGIDVDDGGRTTEQNFMKLRTKRIIGYAHQNLVADNYLQRHAITDVVKLPVPLVKKSYYLLFSHQFIKANPHVAEKLWNKIAELRDNVTSERLSNYSEK